MNKRLIRLTESDLHKIVKESAKKILKETEYGKNEQIDDEFSQQLTAEIKEFCNSEFRIKYEPYRMAYQIMGSANDDSLWANFLFAMLRNNLKVVKYGNVGQTSAYIWFEKR